LSAPGEEKIYAAIAETQMARRWCEEKHKGDTTRNGQFHALINSALVPRIAGVGYSAGNWIEYWLDHLTTLGVFVSSPGHDFPASGPASAETAARQLYAMAQAVAQAATQATSNRPDGQISMQSILAQLEGTSLASDETMVLRACVSPMNGRRATHVRYFVRCARALGILQFVDVRASLDLIASPRLATTDEPAAGSSARSDSETSYSE
jgi:hypothetical protein